MHQKNRETIYRKRFRNHTLTVFLNLIFIQGLTFLSIKVFTNVLTMNEYGLYTFWYSVVVLTSNLSSSIFCASLWRYLARVDNSDNKKANRLINLAIIGSFSFLLIIFIFFTLLYLFFNFQLVNTERYLLILSIVSLISLALIIREITLVIAGTKQKSNDLLFFTGLFHFLSILSAIVGVIIFKEYSALLLSLFLGLIPPVIISLNKISRDYGITLPERKDILLVVKYGAPRTLMKIIWLSVPFVTYFLLNFHIGEESVAIMSLSIILSSFVSLIIENVSLGTFRPYMTNCYESGDIEEANRFSENLMRYVIFFACILIFWMIVFSPILIELLSTTSYISAAKISPFMILSAFLTSISTFWLVGIDLSEKTYILSFIYFIAFLILTSLLIILIPLLQLTGAALSILGYSIFIFIFTIKAGNSVLHLSIKLSFLLKFSLILVFSIISYFIFLEIFHSELLSTLLTTGLYFILNIMFNNIKIAEIFYNLRSGHEIC